MEMGTQGSGRRRLPQRERLTAEDDALSQIAREAEARLAAKRAARAEAREIRMKELERQQKEIYQVQKKYYGLETKWGDIEQWMEESERYSHRFRRNPSASDEDERMSVGSRGSLRTNGHDADLYGSSSLNRKSSRSSRSSKESKVPSRLSSREEKLGSYYSDLGLSYTSLPSRPLSASQNGARASLYDESIYSGSRRYSASNSHPPSEYSGYLGSGSRASSRASSAHGSPVVEERPEKDFAEKGSRNMPSLSAATLASLGGTSSRRGSGDTSISVDTEASMREIKEINELKDQIQDVEGKYMQGLKEMKDSLAEVEEKYRKAMVSNAQLDNEKTNFMYQVDTLKDALLELEEQLAESRRQYEEKNKEFEREKHAHSVLQFQFAEAKEALKQREEMLAEIRQLQQKQESYIREISDLQETIEWRDKKIGALERQKEYFDSIRSERDDLRAEAILLKEELKKHGIILNSEITTNGEPLDNLSNVSHLGSPKMSQQETNALKSSGDGTLGRASEVEVASENVDKVGESPVLQPQADSAEAGVDTKALPPDGNAEAENPPQDHTMVPETLAKDPTHVLETHSVPENSSEQVEPGEGGDRLGAGIESNHLIDLKSNNIDQNQEPAGSPYFPGDEISQDGDSSLDAQNEKKELVEKQKEGKPEEEGSRKLAEEADLLGTPDIERTDTGIEEPSENHSESLLEGMEAKDGTQVNTEADSERAEDGTVSGDEKCANLTKGEPNTEEAKQFIKEEPIQTILSSKLQSSQPEKMGKRVIVGENECSEQNMPTAQREGQKGEICDSSSKKSKNKKKKNKKKKSPPADSSEDVKKELVFQNTEEEEEEEVKLEAKDQAQDTLGKGAQEEKPETRTNLEEYVDCPEEAKADLDDNPNQEVDKAKTPEGGIDGDSKVSELDDDAAHPLGTGGKGEVNSSEAAEAGSIGEASIPAKKAIEQSQISKLENQGAAGSRPKHEDVPSSPSDSPPTETMEENSEQSDEQPETAEEALESNSLDSDELEDPVGSSKAESKEDAQDRTSKGKDKNKEECTMS
ncbi:leucine-rich repeat flightless-interacting protein 1 isoform X3 [Trichosurus vulpecula]|uniref:leucine-rich repeat flightless-interacting protein 1 isoform X3 n=1 Tax=Trichosurus vulpecula TaxID=9337 RepID=UPI00186B2CFB|nr:leucine-rich repeat flightless-interacting protein 1 isoform X3 [Trichosurus vulpecula]